jgi:hypothetical protein
MQTVSFIFITTLTLGMAAEARGEAEKPPVPAPATAESPPAASQPVPAPAATNSQPAFAPVAPYDPWRDQPYFPPNAYPPAQGYPMYSPYPMPAQPWAPPPGYHTHDGFFLRLMMGAGYMKVASASSGYDLQAAGAVFGDTISLGASIGENLQLAWDTTVFMGDATTGGQSRAQYSTGAFFGLIQMGPAVSYYFMPDNIYIAGSFGLGGVFLSERRDGQAEVDHRMKMGWGATVSGGKEWWTSDNWGLGAVGRLTYAQSREETTGCLFRGYNFTVAFSATYN